MSDKCLEYPAAVEKDVLNTIGKDFAAFYGNPHLSSYMESEDDDDDTGSVRIRLLDDHGYLPREMTAYYGNKRLSSHHQDDSDDGVSDTEIGARLRIVNFHPEPTVFAADDVSEDPYSYDDDIMTVARDIALEDDEDIMILPETPV